MAAISVATARRIVHHRVVQQALQCRRQARRAATRQLARHTGTRTRDGVGVVPLVGDDGEQQLREALQRSTEHGAGAAVRRHHRCSREQQVLRNEPLDTHVGRHRAHRDRVEGGPDGCHRIDLETGQRLERCGPWRRLRGNLGTSGQVHQRPRNAQRAQPVGLDGRVGGIDPPRPHQPRSDGAVAGRTAGNGCR